MALESEGKKLKVMELISREFLCLTLDKLFKIYISENDVLKINGTWDEALGGKFSSKADVTITRI